MLNDDELQDTAFFDASDENAATSGVVDLSVDRMGELMRKSPRFSRPSSRHSLMQSMTELEVALGELYECKQYIARLDADRGNAIETARRQLAESDAAQKMIQELEHKAKWPSWRRCAGNWTSPISSSRHWTLGSGWNGTRVVKNK